MTTPRDSLMFFLLLLSSFFTLLTQPIPRLLKSIALAAIVYSTLQHGPTTTTTIPLDVKLGFGGSSKQQADQFPYSSKTNKNEEK